jgi:hypothetical protein
LPPEKAESTGQVFSIEKYAVHNGASVEAKKSREARKAMI